MSLPLNPLKGTSASEKTGTNCGLSHSKSPSGDLGVKSTCFLALGTNLGNKENNLQNAIQHIAKKLGKVIAQSSVIESEPWGFVSENSFLNMVIKVETALSPLEVLKKTQQIERLMGRTKKTHTSYQDRIIDIDIILYDDVILDTPELKLPHPLFRKRDFVLIPLREIAPNVMA